MAVPYKHVTWQLRVGFYYDVLVLLRAVRYDTGGITPKIFRVGESGDERRPLPSE